MTESETATLRLERFFDASPERVFSAWTETDQLAQWFGPETVKTEVVENDLRPGGRYRFVMNGEGGEVHRLSGEYRAIEPPTKLVMTWKWETAESATQVTLNFEPRGDGTLVRLTQEGFPSADVSDNHKQGWTSSFNCLDEELAQ